MSKRTDAIHSLFTAPKSEVRADALSADNIAGLLPRVSSGSVRSLKDTFSGVERENEALRRRIESGSVVVEIDPALIDPSPIQDRFSQANDAGFEVLKGSIAQRGQEVPILVREHPAKPGRYQSAYGHRRIRAARELALPVKAIIRPLTDEDLIIAQGVENSAREDLSFIERAVFAMKMEAQGYQRSVVQEALTIDRAEVSKLVSVARAVPGEIMEAIGRAPKIGRGRWQSLCEALKDDKALQRVRDAVRAEKFDDLDSGERFAAVLSAANKSPAGQGIETAQVNSVTATSGQSIGRVSRSAREIRISIDPKADAGFSAYLVTQLPDLFETYLATVQKSSGAA